MGAVITKSAQTQILASRSRYVISGMDSFFASSSPSDAWEKIADWKWTFSDGQVLHGGVVTFAPVVAATHTCTLEVTFADGTKSSIGTTIVAVTANVIWQRYVSSSIGNDGNDGLTPSTPYATFQKALDEWVTARGGHLTTYGGTRNSFGQISMKSGDTFVHNSAASVDFGPLLINVFGGTARAIITNNIGGTDGMQLSRNGHDTLDSGDSAYNVNVFDNCVYWDSIELVYATPKWYSSMEHVNTQFTNGKITNGGVGISSGFDAEAQVLYNTEVSGSTRNGVFFSSRFSVIDSCNIHDCGTTDGFDNEIYQSAGAFHCSVRSTTLARGTAADVGGYNTSGGNKVYSCDVSVTGCRSAISFPGNPAPAPGEPGFDFIFERMSSTNSPAEGYIAQLGGRFSLRNCTSLNDFYAIIIGCSQDISVGVHETIAGFHVLNFTASNLRGPGLFVKSGASSYFTNFKLLNSAFYQLSTGGTGTLDHSLVQMDSVDLPHCTFDYNRWFRAGDTAASTTFGWIDGAERSFTYWQGLSAAPDANSTYGDPGFVAFATDMHLADTSPCIDAAFNTGLILNDFDETSRPQGVGFDVGAYESTSVVTPPGLIPAFPGAEGFGSTTIGGRGGVVIHVTNLNESGPGSFREAIEFNGPRIIVFDVSGTIDHKEKALAINHPFVTILGQTAPGDGICFSGEEFRMHTHDIVIRFCRFRTGDVDVPHDGWDNRDCLNFGEPDGLGGGTGETYNIVIDHCSFSWAVDETVTVYYDAHDITMQWCFFYQGLSSSHHPEGPHSMGLLTGLGATNISIHHCMIADCNERNPQFAGNMGAYDPLGVVDFRNNLIFNWQTSPCEVSKPGNRLNLVANWWKAGPNSPGQASAYPIMVQTNGTTAAPDAQIHVSLNLAPTLDGRAPTVDNWPMVRNFGLGQLPSVGHQQALPFDCPAVTTYDAKVAAAMILDGGGATRPKRDEADARVVAQARRRCWPSGTDYIIDSPSEFVSATTDANGWPILQSTPAPVDSDGDGMPDTYEIANGLNPADAADAAAIAANGYSNVENYAETLI